MANLQQVTRVRSPARTNITDNMPTGQRFPSQGGGILGVKCHQVCHVVRVRGKLCSYSHALIIKTSVIWFRALTVGLTYWPGVWIFMLIIPFQFDVWLAVFTVMHAWFSLRRPRIKILSERGQNCTRKHTRVLLELPKLYHRFRFYATFGGFHQKKIVFRLPSVIDTIYGNLCMRRAGFASNGFQLSRACSLYIFGRIWSTRYCDDSSCWTYVIKKVNQVVQRDFNCRLSSWTRAA